jgi:acyl-CoA thioesterase FadM
MGLVHTPRVVAAVARGYFRHRMGLSLPDGSPATHSGFGPSHPHIYHARANLFDVDYLGHMNNAAYLAHAELARWEWIASSGMLPSMIKHNIAFLVTASTIRYRKEIRPVYRKFQVQSYVAGLDDKHMWIYQTFRHYANHQQGDDRIRAQYLLQGVAIQGRTVLNPKDYFRNIVGVDASMMDELAMKKTPTMEEIIQRFEDLDQSFRVAASEDDHLRS